MKRKTFKLGLLVLVIGIVPHCTRSARPRPEPPRRAGYDGLSAAELERMRDWYRAARKRILDYFRAGCGKARVDDPLACFGPALLAHVKRKASVRLELRRDRQNMFELPMNRAVISLRIGSRRAVKLWNVEMLFKWPGKQLSFPALKGKTRHPKVLKLLRPSVPKVAPGGKSMVLAGLSWMRVASPMMREAGTSPIFATWELQVPKGQQPKPPPHWLAGCDRLVRGLGTVVPPRSGDQSHRKLVTTGIDAVRGACRILRAAFVAPDVLDGSKPLDEWAAPLVGQRKAWNALRTALLKHGRTLDLEILVDPL